MINLFVGNQQFGTANVEVFDTWSDASEGWIFPNLPGGLEHYLTQLPKDACAPVVIFCDITVNTALRRQGLGSAGMLATMRHFRNKGARVAFLRIGTQGEEWSIGKVWRQGMYEKLGWVVLQDHHSNMGDVPIMWHSMKGDLSCPRIEELELEILDDDFCGHSTL